MNKIKAIIDKMTPDQKIGAVITFGMSGTIIKQTVVEAIQKYHCAGIRITPYCRFWYSYIDPKNGKILVEIKDETGTKKGVSPSYCPINEFAQVLHQLQTLAAQRSLGIGLHISFDQEGGSSADFRMGGVNIFPKPMGIRAANDSEYAYKVAYAVAQQAKAVGLNWIHSPVLDINSNPDNPEISTRAYSDIAQEVVEYAEQAFKGFKDGGIIATGKHFPGRGDSNQDAHFSVPVSALSEKVLNERELLPYRMLIAKGLVPTIMLAHNIYKALDENEIATVSRKIIQGLLRERLGYKGVITTDSMTMSGIATRYGVAEGCAKALQAGADIVLMKADNHLQGDTFITIKQYVDEGKITEEELDAKIYRVLSLKSEYGILNASNNKPTQNVQEVFKKPEIINLSSEMAQKSVMIVRDAVDNLPFPTDKPVLVIEQALQGCSNDFWWHSGMFSEYCQKYNSQSQMLEIGVMADSEDYRRVETAIKDYDYVVMTNFFFRSKLPNNELVKKVCELDKKVVLITNTPYKLNTPDDATTVILSLATSPKNLEVTAGVLFGSISPQGVWPVANRDIVGGVMENKCV
jgi:beta-N-acetylhexosaminidase